MNPESNGVKTWQWVVTVLVIIVLIVLGYFMFRGGETATDIDTGANISPSSTNVADNNRVVVTDQFPGNIVYLSSVQLANPGFVVIQKDNAGKPGAIIGSQYFDKGINPGRVTLIENTVENGTYYAVIYSDTNNDRVFDSSVDMPLKNDAGDVIMKVFRATASVAGSKE